jgi:1,4-dihydroxy-2-naphthoate octaprenyltransferase
MGSLKDWLQLFRSHTSPLEMLIAASGAALATGSILSWEVLLFLVFGWLYHNAGYGHNSVEDYIRGFDKDDPHKSHHPLQRGAIDPMVGRAVTLAMIVLSFVYGVSIGGIELLPLSLLVVLTLMGFVYNIYGKKMGVKFLPIAIAHSLLFPFAYFGSGGPSDPGSLLWVALILTAYLVLQIVYQIMIEGDLKDIDMSEASLLSRLGVKLEKDRFTASILARILSASIKVISIGLLFGALYLQEALINDYLLVAAFSLILLFLDRKLMMSRCWDHTACLRTMALMEVSSTFALVAAVSPTMGGPIPAVILMVLGIAYFILMNRFLWGTGLVPKV